MKTGIFINTKSANCSIYSSGKMLYDTLKNSVDYTLQYVEINDLNIDRLYQGYIESSVHNIPKSYDFYVFNYHHITMKDYERVDSNNFHNLPGKKFCIILEMNKNDPFAAINPPGFTGFIVLDPTMHRPEKNVYAFPRPLVNSRKINKITKIPKVPIIGTFGYGHPGKGFDKVVEAVYKEFDTAHIRINISPSTYADQWFGDSFKNQVEQECRKYERPGLTVEFTRNYYSDEELIEWCSNNTLNCFLYDRVSPGLAAAPDQAIISGAPLAVSTNTTFRHIHKYIKPYPEISLKDSILISQKGVERMQQDWSIQFCTSRLAEIVSK